MCPSCDALVIRVCSGQSIIVTDPNKFARDVLPKYFKHDNIRSFIRQLNIYGFHRCRGPQGPGGEPTNELEFSHAYFVEGRKDLIRKITRSAPQSNKRGFPFDIAPPKIAAFDYPSLLREMHTVQESLLGVDQQLQTQTALVRSRMSALVVELGIQMASGHWSGRAVGHPEHPQTLMDPSHYASDSAN